MVPVMVVVDVCQTSPIYVGNLGVLTEYNLALCIDPSTFVFSRDADAERMQHYFCIFYRIQRRCFATYLYKFKTTSCENGSRKRRDIQQFSLMWLWRRSVLSDVGMGSRIWKIFKNHIGI